MGAASRALRLAVAAITAGALALAGCGDDTEVVTTTAVPPPAVTVPGPPPQPLAYRYTARLEATVQGLIADQRFATVKTGEFRAPDSHFVRAATSFDGVAQPTETVTIIGADAWYDDGRDGSTVALPATDRRVRAVVADFTSADGSLLPDPDLVEAITATAGVPTVLDGAAVVRFTADEEVLETFAPGREFLASPLAVADELSLELWARVEDGAVVRAVLTVRGPAEVLGATAAAGLPAGSDVEFTVTVDIDDIDDPGIVVAAPSHVVPGPEPILFIDPDGRFTAEFPPGWTLAADLPDRLTGGREPALLLLSPFGEVATYSIVVEHLDDPATLETFGDRAREEVVADTGLVLVNDRLVDFPGGTADALELERRTATGLEREVRILFVADGVGYTLTFRAPDAEFGRLLDEVGVMLGSFRSGGP